MVFVSAFEAVGPVAFNGLLQAGSRGFEIGTIVRR